MGYIFTSIAVQGINQSITDRFTLFPARVRVWGFIYTYIYIFIYFLLTLEYEVCLYLSYSTGNQAMNKSMFYLPHLPVHVHPLSVLPVSLSHLHVCRLSL